MIRTYFGQTVLTALLCTGLSFVLASPAVAQRGGSTGNALDRAKAEGIDTELTREERLALNEREGTGEAVNVAQQYSQLLSRDAITIEPSEKGDPMIIPFVHDKVILEKWRKSMDEAFGLQQYSLAKSYAKQIINKYPDSEQAIVALQMIGEIDKRIGELEDDDFDPTEDPTIAPWVRSNMTAIIFDTEDPIVLIGFDTLRVGDAVPDYPDHVIDEIRPESVVFRVSNEFKTKRLEVNVATAE